MARNESEAKAEKKQGEKKEAEDALVALVCPYCGNEDAENMTWKVTKKAYHPIERDKNRLVVDMCNEGHSEIEDWDLYCDGCDNAFPVPDDIEVDW